MKTKQIPIIINGGLDTKTNPKLVKPGAALQLENMYQKRAGEWRPRNGFTFANAQGAAVGAADIFVPQRGGLAAVGSDPAALTSGLTYPVATKYGSPSGTGFWSVKNPRGTPYPAVTCNITGAPALQQTSGSSTLYQADAYGPDLAYLPSNRIRLSVCADANVANTHLFVDAMEVGDGFPPPTANFPTTVVTLLAGATPKVLAFPGSGTAWGIFYQSAANTLKVTAYAGGTGSGGSLGTTIIAADMAASGLFDIKLIPGQTAKVAVAYAALAGGIKCGLLDMSGPTFTPVVATAGADATLTLGWLDDQTSSGSMYLATAGTAAGVVLRSMSPTTFVVATTQTIDATATANVRNVTGHISPATAWAVVYWDLATKAASDLIMASTAPIGGAGTAPKMYYGNHSIYSRTVKFPNGFYYFLGSCSSSAQPLYTLLPCDGGNANISTLLGYPVCPVLSGEGGGARPVGSLTSPVTVGSAVTMAVQRARKITTPTGSTSQLRTVAYATFSTFSKLNRARELGGTVFLPGGIIHRDDGSTIEPAVFPIYPEAPISISTTAIAGSMTSGGTYLYRHVLRTTDAAGRVTRSAASIPLSTTLGAGDTATRTTFPEIDALRGDTDFLTYGQTTLEIYRQGPAASGASLYNKVGEQSAWKYFSNGAIGGQFDDTMSDANAALGEAAYFNGNVLENFAPPSTTLLEVNDNRVAVVSAEDPTELWFSKEYKPGAGLAFNSQSKLAITGDGAGAITALAALFGRWVVFKASAIYVISGTGPNDLGQGGYGAPQAVTRTVGTSNPSSVIDTPNGLLFQATTGGIWLLGSDLSVTEVGAPMEQYALAESVVGVASSSLFPVVRMVFPSGRMIEWDYNAKTWYTHQLKVTVSSVNYTVTGCVNSPIFGWCYALSNGDVMCEASGQAFDRTSDFASTGIVPAVSLPHLNFAGLSGYQRLYSLDLLFDVIGNHTFSVDAEYNYSGALTGSPKTKAMTTATPTAQVQYLPPDGQAKCTSCRPVITVIGSPTGGTFRLTSVTAVVGIKSGTNISDGNRLT